MKAIKILEAGAHGREIQSKIESMLPSQNPVDHLANIINLINSEIKQLKAKEALLAQERKHLEFLVGMAEKNVFDEMKNDGLVELGGSLIKYIIKLNPPKLVIENESLIPQDYKQQVVTTEIRKDAIKDELKMGAEIPGCRLVQEQSLQLKTNS